MSIIQSGYPKAGNYWLWSLIQAAGKKSGHWRRPFISDQPIYPLSADWELSFAEQREVDMLSAKSGKCFFTIPPVFAMPVADIVSYAERAWHVWSHSSAADMTDKTLRAFSKRVYIIRDPRDGAVSLSHYMMTPFVKTYGTNDFGNRKETMEKMLDEYVRNWVLHVCGYIEASRRIPIHFIFYEELVRDFDRSASPLFEYLGLNLTPESFRALRNECSLDSMKLKSPAHVRRGSVGEGVRDLSPDQIKRILRIAGPMLEFLGYKGGGSGPRMPADADPRGLERIRRHVFRRTVTQKIRRVLDFVRC